MQSATLSTDFHTQFSALSADVAKLTDRVNVLYVSKDFYRELLAAHDARIKKLEDPHTA